MKFIFAFILLASSTNLFSQLAGNQIYNNYGYRSNEVSSKQNFVTTDSTLTINVNILLNKRADKFILTLGTSEEAKTPKEAITKINARITQLENSLISMGIKKEDYYVDFISQSRIYDYDIEKSDQVAVQVDSGFEVKKNIITTLDEIDQIENIILIASNLEIYDIVKVDYINDDTENIYTSLLNEASEIIANKKKNYQQNFKSKWCDTPRATDHFYYLFPKDQYRAYEAYDSSEIDRFSSNKIKKIARKTKTHYFERIDYSGFDKVINNTDPQVGIQYILNVSATYKLKCK